MFAHDTKVALAGAAALVNTRSWPGSSDTDETAGTHREDLATIEQLRAFMTEWRWTGAGPRTAADVAAVRDLRPRLRALWDADVDTVVREVNALLREHEALPQLVTHGEFGWHLHATPSGAPVAARMAVEAAMALIDLIRVDELDRLRVCAADDCANVVVDLSRNRSRRFCEDGCGNRANVAAYRERRRH
ncbi:CGNR zinc finger domain-containing protein [Janibacter sp. G1551]|uniref:CGNR zinc finger domain-containing protein n=1 Tax=Janibacter sp. G1551 TaxID=3420440 RepID=UPI003CFC6486